MAVAVERRSHDAGGMQCGGSCRVRQKDARWPARASFGPVSPQLPADLPQLPDDLEHRFLHRDRVLWDAHANLVVDYIRSALP